MKAKDIFLGPIVRRAQQDLVVICIATTKPLVLRFSVKKSGASDWLGHDNFPLNVEVSPNLYFYFGRVTPESGSSFPTQTLLAYSIGEVDPNTEDADYASFEAIVKEDTLAYEDLPLPTFFLQAGGRKLVAMYGSCRKIHDVNGGKFDALSHGDLLIEAAPTDLDKRPAILCLGGDQIYADDVDSTVMTEVVALAKAIEVAKPEDLPVALPSGKRKDYVTKNAKFTSGESDNHLVTFAEYLAMYGLMWNKNNWVDPSKVAHFTDNLPKVRRLLANVPTYMIFDDHDVTDDWNLSVQWRQDVKAFLLGKRIVANALMAFWLCQGYGNDPTLYKEQEAQSFADLITARHTKYGQAEDLFWGLNTWEFFTPTYPFIYFLDTRTQRGLKDGPLGTDQGAPAYLKKLEAWQATMKTLRRLLGRQNRNLPLVLVAAAPVFGFKFIEDLQGGVSAVAGPYFLDLESWSANARHLKLFLQLMGDANVVLLSGDVHYAFTSTARFTVFDDKTVRDAVRQFPQGVSPPASPPGASPTYDPLWTSYFLQLTSSALKNFASTAFTQTPAGLTAIDPPTIMTEDGSIKKGKYENGEFTINEEIGNPIPFGPPLGVIPTKVKKEDLKPSRLFSQKINDASNSRYLGAHNLGVVTFNDKTVNNCFYTQSGRESERNWDFTNRSAWP